MGEISVFEIRSIERRGSHICTMKIGTNEFRVSEIYPVDVCGNEASFREIDVGHLAGRKLSVAEIRA